MSPKTLQTIESKGGEDHNTGLLLLIVLWVPCSLVTVKVHLGRVNGTDNGNGFLNVLLLAITVHDKGEKGGVEWNDLKTLLIS